MPFSRLLQSWKSCLALAEAKAAQAMVRALLVPRLSSTLPVRAELVGLGRARGRMWRALIPQVVCGLSSLRGGRRIGGAFLRAPIEAEKVAAAVGTGAVGGGVESAGLDVGGREGGGGAGRGLSLGC